MPKIEMVSKTETKWVDKDGLGNAFLRFFDWGNNGWGQEAVPVKVDDVTKHVMHKEEYFMQCLEIEIHMIKRIKRVLLQ